MSPEIRVRMGEIADRLTGLRSACPEGTVARWDLDIAIAELMEIARDGAEPTTPPFPAYRKWVPASPTTRCAP